MLTRRSFVAAAASLGVAPLISAAQTPKSEPGAWPSIQGDAVDQRRTRLVDGAGIVNQPGDIVTAAPELEFVATQEYNPSMLLSNSIVLSRAMGPELPLIATDASSGTELWRRNRVSTLLGATGNTVAYVVSPEDDDSLPILKAGRIDVADDNWEMEVGDIAGGSIIGNRFLIYTQMFDDEKTIIARDVSDGRLLWSNDASGFGSRIPGVFASNGNVVVGVTPPHYKSIKIVAWSMDTGEVLWDLENEHFLTIPSFVGDDIVVLTADGLHKLDALTGQDLELFEVPNLRGGLFTMGITAEAAILLNYGQITSVSLQTGEVLWTRPPAHYPEIYDFLVCDGVIYNLEESADPANMGIVVRGYNVSDGSNVLEYAPTDPDGNGLKLAAFLVANGHLYLATDQGISTVLPTKETIASPIDPVYDRAFSSPDLGFSYSWGENWIATGSSFMTPNGQSFAHSLNGAVAAQSAKEDKDTLRDFMRNWHANLGPDDRYIRGINPVDAPRPEFMPENAEVLGVEYSATFAAPYDALFGIRVLVHLREGNLLIFEFLQADSLYLETIDSFATFFEDLEIEG